MPLVNPQNFTPIVPPTFPSTLALPSGSSLIGFIQAGTGAGATDLQTRGRLIVYVTDFYANGVSGALVDPTGVIDSTLGIAAALSQSKSVIWPAGTYKTTANLVATNVPAIWGEPGRTVIKPTAAVTKALTITNTAASQSADTVYPYPTFIHGIDINGTSTTGATGFYIGDGAVSANITLSKCQSYRFIGAGGVGIRYDQAVNIKVYDCVWSKNNVNEFAYSSANPTCPTTIRRIGCENAIAVVQGFLQQTGNEVSATYCVFESNGAEGASITPLAGGVNLQCVFLSCHFENNQLTSGARTSNYSFVADATAGGGCSVEVYLEKCEFGVTGATEKAARFSNVVNSIFNGPRINSNFQSVNCDNNSQLFVDNWPEDSSPSATAFSISGQTTHFVEGIWQTWTPTLSAQAGTYTSTAIPTSRFMKRGKTGFVVLKFDGTTSVSTNWLQASLPTGFVGAGASPTYTAGTVDNAGTPSAGTIQCNGTALTFRKADASAFAVVGANNGGSASICMEVS